MKNYYVEHNLPWPIIDTPGKVVPPCQTINLMTEKYRKTSSAEWAEMFQTSFELLIWLNKDEQPVLIPAKSPPQKAAPKTIHPASIKATYKTGDGEPKRVGREVGRA